MLHIPQEVYEDLNRSIQSFVSDMDSTNGGSVAESETGDVLVALKFEVSIRRHTFKFRDDAWGAVRTFTEKSWRATLDNFSVEVTDGEGNPVECDFDPEMIETEYEETTWE